MSLFISEGMDDSTVRYVCRNCGWSFIRITNAKRTLTTPCSHCENGIMDMQEE